MACRNFFTIAKTIAPSYRPLVSKCYSTKTDRRTKADVQRLIRKSLEGNQTKIKTPEQEGIKDSLKTQHQETVKDPNLLQKAMQTNIISQVNSLVETNTQGKLFCVIFICGKQFKVSVDDLVVIRGYWPPNVGDKIRLEKILLVGSKDFTLLGRPILPLDQVAVYATVIEKTFSQLQTWFRYKPRKQYHRTHLDKTPLTYIRINSIDIIGKVNQLGDTDGFERRLF